MDGGIGLLFSLLTLIAFCFGLGLVFKNRSLVQQWLNTPYYAEDDRKLKLRRKIEDCQAELTAIEEQEKEQTTTES